MAGSSEGFQCRRGRQCKTGIEHGTHTVRRRRCTMTLSELEKVQTTTTAPVVVDNDNDDNDNEDMTSVQSDLDDRVDAFLHQASNQRLITNTRRVEEGHEVDKTNSYSLMVRELMCFSGSANSIPAASNGMLVSPLPPKKKNMKKPTLPPPTRRTSSRLRKPSRRTMEATMSSTSASYYEPKRLQWKTKKRIVATTTASTSLSFDCLWGATVGVKSFTQIHTLILGTHPGMTSLGKREYFAHPSNSFWWIAGDCLGFRRMVGKKRDGQSDFKICEDLRYDESHILSYDNQVKLFCSYGFALWDIVATCQRKGSLDQDIQKGDVPNNIRCFVERHPSIRTIVIANGTSGCHFFNRHFQDWWRSGNLRAHPKEWIVQSLTNDNETNNNDDSYDPQITCIMALSTSPACALYSYKDKRDWWDKHVYQPGLAIHLQNQMMQLISI